MEQCSEALEQEIDIKEPCKKENPYVKEDNLEELNDFEKEPTCVENDTTSLNDDVKGSTSVDSGIEPGKSISEESAKLADKTEARIASAEQDDMLNVIIQSKEISITMQPSCPTDSQENVLQSGERKPSTTSIDSITTPDATNQDSKRDDGRKASTTSADYITGSDTNSDPTLVTDCDSCVRNSHDSSRGCSSDTSDSEDMFDKIVPKKHRKLACAARSEISLSSSDSSSELDEPGDSMLDSKLDRQNTITEFIDEYKRFFHSVDLRDPKCVLKNRHKIVRPQTAKSQRTDPIVYEGVLKTMEQNSNHAKIEQVRQEREADDRSLAKEAVLERLMKGHDAVDMNLEHQMISIGGKAHNFNEYRLEVFRQDQEKLQNLIDRVTAQKDKYNAHIDSIHDQLANIMDDYGQISVKLRKVNDMIQNIGEEVGHEHEREETSISFVGNAPTTSIAKQFVERMTKEQIPDLVDDVLVNDEEQPSSDESDLFDAKEHVAARTEIGLMDPTNFTARKPIPQEFGSDPVYRKFIDIQYEIDKLTEDQIFDALNEAARELQEEEELEAKLLHDAVDEYWNPTTDLDDFRRNLNLDAHPIIQRFKRFIECQGTDTDDTDSEAHVRRLESAYHKYERRLSNHLFDEYLILSRKASIATTTGGESSATELELIEIEGGHVLRASTSRRTTAWDLKESMEEPVAEVEEEPNDEILDKRCEEQKLEELEDEESKPEQDVLCMSVDIKDVPEISDEDGEKPKLEVLGDKNGDLSLNANMTQIPDNDCEEPTLEEPKEEHPKPEEVMKDPSADVVEHQ
uniref:Uncharacterized protein n=1 Tax=Anopheles maculatus TaxID=74869 RepID=A0A182SEV6_9DIPT